MLEFVIITSLKCIGDIDEFMYNSSSNSSSKSPLMSKYFSESGGGIIRSKLITRVKMENFENSEDALNLAILYFVHTFMLSQHKEAPISVAYFQMVEDGRYIHFSWGKINFEKLINLWRQDFRVAKQLYSLGGMPHALNVWIFECYSEVDKKTTFRQRNIIPRILNWSVECTRPKYESFMSGMFSKCSFKNLQPTSEEVRTLDLSFSEDFVVFDPTPATSTSIPATLKRSGDEDQSRVVTADDDYNNFTARPTQEFLKKAHLATPLSTEQPSKRRKIVIFQEVSLAVTDGQKSTSSPSVRYVSEIGVSPEREQLKSVPSSLTTPKGTPKSNLDMEKIKSYVKTYIAELKTLISNIPAEVVKALKNEENKKSLEEKIIDQQEDEDKGSVIEISNDEPSVLEPLKTEIQDCVDIHTECPTITEVQFEQKDEHMTDKEEGREEE
ncbi:hypothetical protein P3S68_028370 [Capsicum galapagoense]